MEHATLTFYKEICGEKILTGIEGKWDLRSRVSRHGVANVWKDEDPDAALFCLCLTLSGMHGIYWRGWAGGIDVDVEEKVHLGAMPHAPPPKLQTSCWRTSTSGNAPRRVDEPPYLQMVLYLEAVSFHLLAHSPRVRPLPPMDVVGAILEANRCPANF